LTKIRVEMDIHPVNVYVSKEKKKLLMEEKIYSRIRGYVELTGNDLSEKWCAIRRRDAETFIKLLKLMYRLTERKFEVEITREKYPGLHGMIKQFEEKHGWYFKFGEPEVFWYVIRPVMVSIDNLGYVVEEEELDVDVSKAKEEVWSLYSEIDEKLHKTYENLNISEITNFEILDYNEFLIEATLSLDDEEIDFERRGRIHLDKNGDKYILKFEIDGSMWIENIRVVEY